MGDSDLKYIFFEIVIFCVPTLHRSMAVDHRSECKVVGCITFPRPCEGLDQAVVGLSDVDLRLGLRVGAQLELGP